MESISNNYNFLKHWLSHVNLAEELTLVRLRRFHNQTFRHRFQLHGRYAEKKPFLSNTIQRMASEREKQQFICEYGGGKKQINKRELFDHNTRRHIWCTQGSVSGEETHTNCGRNKSSLANTKYNSLSRIFSSSVQRNFLFLDTLIKKSSDNLKWRDREELPHSDTWRSNVFSATQVGTTVVKSTNRWITVAVILFWLEV